eukprot:TRINITY_DN11019_c0_g2_i1.p1 TRINITY_DN11019_c0_g2~~TRINITY_DN11019_c0_g2_i1.p1  ORF type:complete len:283 (+),score=58.19 TRINITY_DN11019_c0_g2_i1:130-978(+)
MASSQDLQTAIQPDDIDETDQLMETRFQMSKKRVFEFVEEITEENQTKNGENEPKHGDIDRSFSPYLYIIVQSRNQENDENEEVTQIMETLESIVQNFPKLCSWLSYHPSLIKNFIQIYFVIESEDILMSFLLRCRNYKSPGQKTVQPGKTVGEATNFTKRFVIRVRERGNYEISVNFSVQQQDLKIRSTLRVLNEINYEVKKGVYIIMDAGTYLDPATLYQSMCDLYNTDDQPGKGELRLLYGKAYPLWHEDAGMETKAIMRRRREAVSYTHLTLPTIYSV